jgi:hypothetical protein
MSEKRYRAWQLCLLAVAVVVLAFPGQSFAIPAFSRLYGTSCSTCHIDFPQLNDFGKAFKDAGFKFPTDDQAMLKIPPVLLGAPATKELFPHSIWPGSIPGIPPIGLRFNSFFQVTGKDASKFDPFLQTNGIPAFVPRTDFEPGLFSIFTAGNFGSDIAFWVDDDISVSGANANGALGDGYLKFVNVSRFLHLPKDSMHLRIGQFELELPFTQARSIDISPYDIYTQANFGAMNTLFPQQNVSNGFAFAGASQGVELSGGHHYGGYYYALAIVNQNTGTQPIDTGTFVPSATGSNSGGLGFFSDANFKDLYGRLAYRFNLERNPESRHAIQAAGPMGPHDHTYINIGSYYFYGRSVQRFTDGVGDVVTAREPFYRVGGDLTFNYQNSFQIYGLYMYGHDNNLLPFGPDGALVSLPATPGSVAGFVSGSPAVFSGGFIQAEYLPYPWLILIMRYDTVHSTADQLNSAGFFLESPATAPGATNFGLPFSSVRNRYTPGVQFLIHANIKASFEYQIRPQQSVLLNSATNLPIQPFRVNTATAALEFVY